jgi:phage gpG-like protein
MSNAAEITLESKQWEKFLKSVEKKWKDIAKRKEFSNIITIPVFKDLVKHFEEEEGPSGKWKPWSNTYLEHLQRIGRQGNQILQFSGKLRQSITPTKGKVRTNSSGVVFYSNVPYAKAHDEGEGRMPERKFMYISNKGLKNVIEITEKWLLDGK